MTTETIELVYPSLPLRHHPPVVLDPGGPKVAQIGAQGVSGALFRVYQDWTQSVRRSIWHYDRFGHIHLSGCARCGGWTKNPARTVCKECSRDQRTGKWRHGDELGTRVTEVISVLRECTQCIRLTDNPDGLCNFCSPQKRRDAILKDWSPKVSIRFPLDPGTHLPCMDHVDLFGRDETWKRHRAVCARCPEKAREWCLETAIGNDYDWGTWGGTSVEERLEMKKERNEEAG